MQELRARGVAQRGLALVLLLVALAGCGGSPLSRSEVGQARLPVQADVSAPLDRLGLPVVGAVHDALCDGGQDNLVIRDDFEFRCAVREVRVASIAENDLEEARREADRALSQVCPEGRHALADDRSSGPGTLQSQFSCGAVVVDVLLCPAGSPATGGTSYFGASPAPGSTSRPEPPVLIEAERAGVPYVLLVQASQEFYRQPR